VLLGHNYVTTNRLTRFCDHESVHYYRVSQSGRERIARLVFIGGKHLIDPHGQVNTLWDRQ
jgi:hypothetical protein